MKLVCIAACPTGIAHTYMASAAIEKVCKKNNVDVRIEMQASRGFENKLTAEEIAEADAILFANAVEIREKDRFAAYEDKTFHILPGKILRKPDMIIDELKARGLLLE